MFDVATGKWAEQQQCHSQWRSIISDANGRHCGKGIDHRENIHQLEQDPRDFLVGGDGGHVSELKTRSERRNKQSAV